MKLFSKSALAAAVLGMAMSLAHAVEISGVKVDEATKVGGKDLVLSGAGLRTKTIFKIYVLGIYLNKKETTTAGVLAAPGPKRAKIHVLRELTGEEFGGAFLAGINKNLDKEEKAKYVNQLLKFGELFETLPPLKPGDVVTADWVPASGTVISINGKQIIDPLPDLGFYNAILRIWYGDKPAEVALKHALLGEPS
jgi:Chalcone isomerase-like